MKIHQSAASFQNALQRLVSTRKLRPLIGIRFHHTAQAVLSHEEKISVPGLSRLLITSQHNRALREEDGIDDVIELARTKSIEWNNAGPAQFDFRSKSNTLKR
jgi:hypothetical protein